MKKMMMLALILAIATKGLTQYTLTQQLDTLLQTYTRAHKFTGTVLVARHDSILLQKGYGGNNEHTIYQVASVTKTFTAAMVLQLVSQGKLSLNNTLSDYYPGFPNGSSITIEQLLTHTSGLHNFTESDTVITETDEARMVPYLASLPADFTPGNRWHYSNSGYVMLGFIIQKICGTSYWQAIRRHLLTPLHMPHSGFDFTHLTNINKATGYQPGNGTTRHPTVITDSTVPFAAGALYTTVADLYQWHRSWQRYQVVNKALTQKAYTPCTHSNYGYGWQIDSVYGQMMVSHSGAIPGFASNFARIPSDDICIILLSNEEGATRALINSTRKLLAVLYHQPYTLPKQQTSIILAPDILETYTGTYEIPAIQLVVTVTRNNDQLLAFPVREGNPGPTSVLHATGRQQFYDQQDEEIAVIFDTDNTGKVKGFTLQLHDQTHYARKTK